MIIHTAAALKVLKDRNTWEAFDWNRSECGLGQAFETLWHDILNAGDDMEEAWERYHMLYK